MEVLQSEDYTPLTVLVVGLQATTCITLAVLFLSIFIALIWKNTLIQCTIQALSKILPIHDLVDLKKFQKVRIAPQIDAEHCSICYCDITKEVRSNCGHVFCGKLNPYSL